jgi:ABC-type glycerol-3-phosphate transport system substrate-binding protein
VPKKAVALFFALAFVGAAIFVYITFPRSKDQIPTSNNQRQFVTPPGPNTPNTPNGVPVPETVPHPNAPKVPPGPTLHVMTWATAADARRLSDDTDSFAAATGRQVSLTIAGDPVSYRRDLAQAITSDTPPDLCLISSRDFSGLDPTQDLADATPVDGTPPRAVAAFAVNGRIKAVPDEFSVEVLFYNPSLFDRAGIAYPGSHWTWDILEADARAIASLQLKDSSGRPTYALELQPNFDFWNVLCADAGAPALDLDSWRLADASAKESQMRGLELIHDLFQGLAITPTASKGSSLPAFLFAQQRSSLLIAPSDLAATLTSFHYGMTILPRDLVPGSVATVNGWAVPSKSTQADAALALAQYLTDRPVHAGWTAIQPPAAPDDDSPASVCHESLAHALVPRVNADTARTAQFLDQQIDLLAHHPEQTPDALYARIQAQLQAPSSSASVRGGLSGVGSSLPPPKVDVSSQVRGL